jgi:hypothetical protein
VKFPDRLRIESDGTANNTKIVTPDGQCITQLMAVSAITWSVEAGEVSKATIEVAMMPFCVGAEAVAYQMRVGDQLKRIKRIEFEDGSELASL